MSTSSAAEVGRNRISPIDVSRALFPVLLGLLPITAVLGDLVGIGPVYAYRINALLVVIVALFLPKRNRLFRLSTLIAGFLLLLVAGLSTLVNDLSRNYGELLNILLTLGLCRAFIKARLREWAWFCRGWLVAFLGTVPLAVWELITGKHLPGYRNGAWVQHPDWYWQPGATFTNPNLYAFFLVTAVLAAGFALSYGRRPWREIGMVTVVLAPILLYYTESALGIIGLFTVGLVLMLCWPRTRPATILLLVASAIALLFLTWFGPLRSVWDDIAFSFRRTFIDQKLAGTNSFNVRVAMLANGFFLTVRYPLTGAGPGTFEDAVSSGISPIYAKGITNPHSGFFEFSSQYGLIAGLLLLAFWGYLVARLIRFLKRSRILRPALSLLLAGLCASVPLSMCNSVFLDMPVTMLMTAGLVASSVLISTGPFMTRIFFVEPPREDGD